MNRRSAAPSQGSAGRPTADSAIRLTLVERICTMATPAVAERIVDAAVRESGLVAVPDGGPSLGLFIEGPLRDSAERVLGQDAAEALVDDLAPVVRMSLCTQVTEDSQVRFSVRPAATVRPQSPMPTPVAPVPVADLFGASEPERVARISSIPVLVPEPSAGDLDEEDTGVFAMDRIAIELPPPRVRILVASRDERRVSEFAVAMHGHASVQRVEDLFELLDSAMPVGEEKVYVVVDSNESSVHPSTLVATQSDLPEATEIVLWGSDVTISDEFEAMVPETERWTRFAESRSPKELARFLTDAFRKNGLVG